MVAISSETATDVATAKASHLGNLVAAVIKMNSVLNGPGEDPHLSSSVPKTLLRWLSIPSVRLSRETSSSKAFSNVIKVATASLDASHGSDVESLLAGFQSVYESGVAKAAAAVTSSMSDDNDHAGEYNGSNSEDSSAALISSLPSFPPSTSPVLCTYLLALAASLLLPHNPSSTHSLTTKSLSYVYANHMSARLAPLLTFFTSNLQLTNTHSATLTNDLEVIEVNRRSLQAYYEKCVQFRDSWGMGVVSNCLVGSLLSGDLVEQAEKVLESTTFPEGENTTNNQLCRHYYYSGRISALTLDYSKASRLLDMALKKAPSNTAFGFRMQCQKMIIAVKLLMGDVPERSAFRVEGKGGGKEEKEMESYLLITKSVRLGNVGEFERVKEAHRLRFDSDGTYTLIERLAHNVVKAGLRQLSISYSKISMRDIAERLGLGEGEKGERTAEFVASKAIRDGVIDAIIEPAEGDNEVQMCLVSREVINVYGTEEPTEAFHKRIAFCLETRNAAIKGHRYPEDAFKKKKGDKEEEEDKITDEELAEEILEEYEDDF